MVYRCDNCGRFFSDPLCRIERHGNEGPWGERLLCCPYCRIPGMLEEVQDDKIA